MNIDLYFYAKLFTVNAKSYTSVGGKNKRSVGQKETYAYFIPERYM